jgi:hypothetical protein
MSVLALCCLVGCTCGEMGLEQLREDVGDDVWERIRSGNTSLSVSSGHLGLRGSYIPLKSGTYGFKLECLDEMGRSAHCGLQASFDGLVIPVNGQSNACSFEKDLTAEYRYSLRFGRR